MTRLYSLTQRKHFVQASAHGKKWSSAHFLMLSIPFECPPEVAYVGYTVTKKIGGAVERNRIRRRLRVAVRESSKAAHGGFAYVLIARKSALQCNFEALKRDVQLAFSRIASKPSTPKPSHPPALGL